MMAKGGRPSSYKPEYAEQAKKLCELGATDIELADFFGVHVATLHRWSAKYEEFCASLKAGKAVSDERVERSLYHRALGYTFDSEKVFHHQGQITRAKTREHVPPDTTAMIFWLKNRRPDEWRDRKEIDATHRRALSDLSDAELERILKEGDSGGTAEAASGSEKSSRIH